jgi:hypothetical protein
MTPFMSILMSSLKYTLSEGDKVFKTVRFHGIPIAVDRPTGFVQKGKSKDGKSWERTYKNDYGFIEGTRGGDKEELDVFIGPDSESRDVYWATQLKDDGSFDEYKLIVGVSSVGEARRIYLDHIPGKYLDKIEKMDVAKLHSLLGTKDPSQ